MDGPCNPTSPHRHLSYTSSKARFITDPNLAVALAPRSITVTPSLRFFSEPHDESSLTSIKDIEEHSLQKRVGNRRKWPP
jgi:hypothetical protein